MMRSLVQVAVLIGALLASLASSETPEEKQKREEAKAERATKVATATTPIPVGAGELVEAFLGNEVAAGQAYLGKVLDVTGIVGSISKVGDDANVTFLVHGGKTAVQCWFTGAAVGGVARMTKGGIATVRGECTGFLANEVTLHGCMVVETRR